MGLENMFMKFLLVGIIFLVIFIIASYIYTSLALMAIAKRTDTKNAWLAWIPIANIYLMMRIGRLPDWTLALWLLIFLPYFGYIASLGMTIWYWWAIAERRGKEPWYGILMIIPIANLVLMGILAWGKDEVEPDNLNTSAKNKIAKKKVTRKKKTAIKKKSTKKKVVNKK